MHRFSHFDVSEIRIHCITDNKTWFNWQGFVVL